MNLETMTRAAMDSDFRFAAPWFLLGLLILPFVYALVRYLERRRSSTLLFSNLALIKKAGVRTSRFWRTFLNLLRVLALALLFVAMARPQFGRVERQTYSEGIDIALVLDVSLSMRATDFFPNRLEAAKEVLKEFVESRMGDRIGLVVFGTDAVSLIPMTLDYGVVKSFIDRVQFNNIVDGNRTAVGMGLATALAKLRDSKAKSKVVVLLTDGESNAGKIDPLTAAEAARVSKTRVYTIGVGSEGQSGMFGMPSDGGIDEKSLSKIAEMTNGLYFRATDADKLKSIYDQIDKLEKSRVESTQYDNYNDLAAFLIFPSVLLLGLELLLRSTRFIKVP